ncbi:hypothetical protein [Streptomyces vinaceus]|uniref:hypothetical protein n=1 Tax=Streptomyces vinaceus TaxID=1960 RepID=UPI0016747CC0|nr:hypothetical protein [Streptomyces vinaceus]GHE71510.1 hypothetical protein GCM10017778_65930 [Streptomyces vinaceus]
MTPAGPADAATGPESGPGTGAEPDPQVLARAALTRVLEPGDETGGRWLREHGPVRLIRLLTGQDSETAALTGVSEQRLAGYRRRAALADPRRDLATAARSGGRFVCPGSAEFCLQFACCPRSCCACGGLCCG